MQQATAEGSAVVQGHLLPIGLLHGAAYGRAIVQGWGPDDGEGGVRIIVEDRVPRYIRVPADNPSD